MMYLRTGGWVRLWVAALILLIPTLAFAKTITVSAGEKNGIYGALAGASYGDVILLGCGDYNEGGLEFPDGVTLMGTDGDASCVRIVTSGYIPLFFFTDVGSEARLQNLSIIAEFGGPGDVTRGAGALLSNASPTFTNVIFEGLQAGYGGAVYCSEGSSPSFLDCQFKNNYARTTGGAVACVGVGAPQFERCLFFENEAQISGGTINAALGSTPTLTECTVVGGVAAVGSGLTSWDTDGLVMDRVIVVDGVTGRAWNGDAASVPAIDCTNIFGNEGGDWVGSLAALQEQNNNLSANPLFCWAEDPENPFTLFDVSPCSAEANPGCGRIGAFDVNCIALSGVENGEGLPKVSRLHTNYPNPFNPRTTIEFDLKRTGPVDLAVFDVAGRLIKRLVHETVPAGNHEAVWEGKDSRGQAAAAGVYFFRLKTRDTVDTKRMTLIK